MIRTEVELGGAVRHARLDAGLTQQALADRAGVSRALVVGIEAGSRRGAELQRVLAILRALDLAMQLVRTPRSTSSELDDLLAGFGFAEEDAEGREHDEDDELGPDADA